MRTLIKNGLLYDGSGMSTNGTPVLADGIYLGGTPGEMVLKR